MMKSRFKSIVAVMLTTAFVGLITRNDFAGEEAPSKAKTSVQKDQASEACTIQYCGPGAAFAPGGFILITDDGPLLQALQLKWTLPKLSGKDAKKQTKQKKAFDTLVAKLQEKNVSAEFECSARWSKPRPFISEFCVVSVPRLTKESKEKLQKSGLLPAAKK